MHVPKTVIALAAALGVAVGSYGLASAATGSSTTTTPSSSQPAPAAPSPQHPFGNQRSDESALTGDALTKVTAAAKAKVPGGSIIRVETDADGNSKYEAHMLDSSGNEITVYVDADYNVVSTGSPF